MGNKGREFEQLVKAIQEILGEKFNAKVETNTFLEPIGGGRRREFDVLVYAKVNGITNNIVIECKNWNKQIGSPEVDAFHGKCQSFPQIHRKVIISKKGFKRGVQKYANDVGIELIQMREIDYEKLSNFLTPEYFRIGIRSLKSKVSLKINFIKPNFLVSISNNALLLCGGKSSSLKETVEAEALKIADKENLESGTYKIEIVFKSTAGIIENGKLFLISSISLNVNILHRFVNFQRKVGLSYEIFESTDPIADILTLEGVDDKTLIRMDLIKEESVNKIKGRIQVYNKDEKILKSFKIQFSD